MRLILEPLYFCYQTSSATHLKTSPEYSGCKYGSSKLNNKNKSRVAVKEFVSIQSQINYDIKLFLLLI